MAKGDPTTALATWSNIEKTVSEDLNITYQGNRIVCLRGSIDEHDAIKYIDTLRAMLERYQNELEDSYGLSKRKKVSKQISIKMSHVYLMINNRDGLYKIGRSCNPQYRERTLQSEVPHVETIFVSPLTYSANENKLHMIFRDKRVRGEWFRLDTIDINFIKEFSYGEKSNSPSLL